MSFPRFANVQAIDQFKADPRFRVLIGGTEGQDDPCDEQQEEAVDDLKVAGDRLRDRPQGDHRRRDERPRRADRQPSDANDPGYVDLTGMYPHDPAKAKALLKRRP